MTSQQLETFMTVAEQLNFRKAADVLFITQPAVTKQVMLLEQELGMPLFVRSKRDVALTPMGELFYGYATKTKDDFMNFMLRARQLQNIHALAVCIQANLKSDVITEAVTKFIRTHASATVHFEYCDMMNIAGMIANHSYDVYVTNMENVIDAHPKMQRYELGAMSFSFVAKRGYMGVDEIPASLSAYNGCNFIDPYCVPSGSRNIANAALPMEYRVSSINNLGLAPGNFISMPNWESVLMSVKLGTGITLVTDDVKFEPAEDFIRIPVQKTASVLAMWNSDNANPVLADFLEIMKNAGQSSA